MIPKYEIFFSKWDKLSYHRIDDDLLLLQWYWWQQKFLCHILFNLQKDSDVLRPLHRRTRVVNVCMVWCSSLKDQFLFLHNIWGLYISYNWWKTKMRLVMVGSILIFVNLDRKFDLSTTLARSSHVAR